MQTIIKSVSRIICGLVCLVSLGVTDITFTEHLVAQNYNNPWSAFAIDLDDDNDIDVVGSGRLGHTLTWWENTGNFTYQQHGISSISYYAMVVHALDIDEDSDPDILCASQTNGVELWQNQGDQTFVRHIIAAWPYSSFISVADVDTDEDMDVLVACCEGGMNRIGWVENQGGLVFTGHIVTDTWDHANSVCGADLDSDGDTDLIGTASYAGEVAWFENDGNQNFTKRVILSTSARPSSAYVDDVDSDGDMDVLATVCYINQVLWFENDGDQNFTQHIIGSNFFRPHAVRTADFDNDADIDVLAAAINSNEIAWWENIGGTPIQWTKHSIHNNFVGATGIQAIDMECDGDIDVLGAAQFGNRICWWENDLIPGVSELHDEVGTSFHLSVNHTRPHAFSVKYDIPYDTHVRLSIFNVSGQRTHKLADCWCQAGTYMLAVDASQFPSGIYFLRLTAGKREETQKFFVIH